MFPFYFFISDILVYAWEFPLQKKIIQKATQVKNFSVERKNMTILLYVTFLRTLLIYIFPFHPFCSVPIFLNTNEYFLLIHIIIIIIIIQHEKSSIFLLVFIKMRIVKRRPSKPSKKKLYFSRKYFRLFTFDLHI